MKANESGNYLSRVCPGQNLAGHRFTKLSEFSSSVAYVEIEQHSPKYSNSCLNLV